MGWMTEMAKRITQAVRSTANRSTDQQLAARAKQLEIELDAARSERARLERDLGEALLAVTDEASEARVARVRADLLEVHERVADIERMHRRVSEELTRAVENRAAQERAKAIAKAREHADEMTEALRKLSAAGDLAAAAARSFFAARDRFLEACPHDLRPAVTPPLWVNPGQYLQRHIGARCPMFRGEAMRGNDGRGIDYLAQVDEMALIHGDTLSRTFPSEPPSQAA